MAHFIYGTATNTGKGFFTHEDRRAFHLRGFPADVWVIGNNERGAYWLAEASGTEKTKAELQALVRAADTLARTAWDNNNVDGESSAEKIERLGPKPITITLP